MRTFGTMSHPSPDRWDTLRWLLRRRGSYRWAVRVAGFLLAVALLADLLANEKPVYCLYEGRSYFPALSAPLVPLGLARWPEAFHQGDWLRMPFERAIRTPVPYGPGYLDLANARYRGPLDRQEVPGWRFRHWLGTDALGRDVLAGMIHGTRTALLVGLLGTAIALLLGLLVGGLSGYYGDDRLRLGRCRLFLVALALVPAGFYAVWSPGWLGLSGPFAWLSGSLTGLILLAGAWRLGAWLDRRWGSQLRSFPLDLWIMRVVEAIQAMPGLLLLLALLPLFSRPSVWNVVLIVGLIRWPGIARFVRAELLRIRELPYIEAARLSGIPDVRLLWRHALPNALQPVLVVVAFGISSGILLEAFLSFLGMGVPADQVTWGSLLNLARHRFDAWWLAVFPGIGIFLAVTAFNMVGEAVQEWLDHRAPYLPRRD
jgi:peptide/nickel transport system permease protein